MRLDGYVRVSRVGGRSGERFISPDVQRERIAAKAKLEGHSVAKVHEDLDLPGTHSRRPGLQAALERVEQGKVDGIIVARLDRFGRSAIDIHRNLERIREAKGTLLTAAENIDTSTSIGRFFLSITAAFAELEIDRITENWQSAREQAVERGVHVSGHTPVGYRRRPDGRERGAMGAVLGEREQPGEHRHEQDAAPDTEKTAREPGHESRGDGARAVLCVHAAGAATCRSWRPRWSSTSG